MNRVHQLYCRSSWWQRHLEALLPWALEGVDLTDATALELGSGPGRTTDWLASRCPKLTALEYDPDAAKSLAARRPDLDVVQGDATALEFPDASYDAVVCFTMLHHVPSSDLQQKLFTEVHRVLKPGGVFAGSDSRWGPLFAVAHLGDTMVLVDPESLTERLQSAGFDHARVDRRRETFRFSAQRPSQ